MGRLLEGVADSQESRILEHPAEDLHPDRQTLLGKSHWKTERRQTAMPAHPAIVVVLRIADP